MTPVIQVGYEETYFEDAIAQEVRDPSFLALQEELAEVLREAIRSLPDLPRVIVLNEGTRRFNRSELKDALHLKNVTEVSVIKRRAFDEIRKAVLKRVGGITARFAVGLPCDISLDSLEERELHDLLAKKAAMR